MGPKKVVAIDDEEIVLKSVKRVLDQAGFEVETTRSGAQGLEWALNKAYDLVITDIRMPDLGGMIVLRDLKKAKPEVPVIIITGYANVQSAEQAIKLGAADYVEKPFTPHHLLKAVTLALEQDPIAAPEKQALVHPQQILAVLNRAATDGDFVYRLLHCWADALDEYPLSGVEKLALLTGDVEWIEIHTGPLTETQKRWLQRPISPELLKVFGW
jgi:FixJ family two-component response regulator